jgi:predicted RNA binding protein YcfA (HicA-like mRNA interferase family)
MKLPRDVSGADLVRALTKLGYAPTRQAGSHVRLTTLEGGEHHITIPAHDPIKVGTLSSILRDLSAHHKLTRDDLIRLLS